VAFQRRRMNCSASSIERGPHNDVRCGCCRCPRRDSGDRLACYIAGNCKKNGRSANMLGGGGVACRGKIFLFFFLIQCGTDGDLLSTEDVD
jgi:hypothetical protein